jgi:hypothetical protein
VKARYTVTGPEVDRKAESAALGLSAAITVANEATRGGVEASFYVRDPSGKVVGRTDADGHGNVNIYGPNNIDRAPSDPFSLAGTGRSAVGRSRGRPNGGADLQGERPTTASSRYRSRRVASEAPPPTTPTKEDSVAENTTTKKTPQKRQEGGEDLAAVLIAAVKERVAGVEVATNASGMTRLLVGKKAFAYLEKGRATGQPVKIPKPLMAVMESLPAGAGFHETKWGLTRTVSRKADVPKVAHALAIAAAAVSTAEETSA